MQTLDFNTLNTGDILITRSNQSWIQVHQLGLHEMAYVVQHVDTQNSAAVIARTGNESTQYILSVDEYGRFTITPMVNTDNASRVDEVFQMSAQEAQVMRLSARLKAERDLSHYLQSQYDNKTPNSVDKFIENFYKGSYMAGEYPTTFIMDMAKGRNLMNELIEGATDVYDAESEKENAVLDKVIAESRKAYDKVVATIKEAGIEYAYNEEAVTLVQPDADYGSRAPRTLRIGTAIVDKETPYIISRITSTRAYVTDAQGVEVGYISNTKANGLTLNFKEAPEGDTNRHYLAYSCNPLPASTIESVEKLMQATKAVYDIMTEHRRAVERILKDGGSDRVRNANGLCHNHYGIDTLAGALSYIQAFIGGAEETKDSLEEAKEMFFWKATRLIKKAYGN